MADPFVIYTMGDTNLFMAALNGVAMLFNGPDLFTGSGYMKLGFGAFFGAVILLTIMVYNAAFKRQFELRLLLAPLFLYIILTLPRVDVALQDIYGQDAVKRVDNIPIGLAIPAAVASGISVVLTNIFEQGYSVVSGNAAMMPRITDDGFVTPLKLLNALRTASTNEGSSSLFQTTKNYYSSCVNNNPNFNAEQYRKSENPLQYLVTAGAQAGGLVYIIQEGTASDNPNDLVTCEQAGKILQATMDSFIDGQKSSQDQYNIIGDVSKYNLRSVLNGQMLSNGSSSGSSPNSTANSRGAGVTGYVFEDVSDAFASIAQVSETQARNFVAATLFNPYMESASYCSDQSSGLTGMAKCTAWVSATNQWEEKNAASATGFLKMMQDGQNILIMISFLLFPIIVIFIMVQGVGSFKILGNYLAFTVAAYLWVPMASIINFYTQQTLADEYYKVIASTGTDVLTLYTASQFYGAVAQKLSLANGMLASVPVLCMMLFSGMMMGMNQLTSRMNSADGGNYDAKVNSPDIQKSAPIATTNSALSMNGQGVVERNGMLDANFQSSRAYSATQAAATENSHATSDAKARVIALQHAISAKQGTRDSTSTGTTNTTAETDGVSQTSGTTTSDGIVTGASWNHKEGTSVNDGSGASTTHSNSSMTQAGGQASAGVTTPKKEPVLDANGKPVMGADGKPQMKAKDGWASGQAGVNASKTGVWADGGANTSGISLNRNKADEYNDTSGSQKTVGNTTSSGTSSTFQTGYTNSKAQEYLKSKEVSEAISKDEKLQKMWNEANDAVEKATFTQQRAETMAMSIGGNVGQLVGSANYNKGGMQELNKAIALSGDRDNIQDRAQQVIGRGNLAGSNEDKATAGTIIAALSSPDDNVRSAAQNIISPNAAQRMNEISKDIDLSKIEAPQQQQYGPISAGSLDPTRAANLTPTGFSGNPQKPSGAPTAPTGRPQQPSAVPAAVIPRNDNAHAAIQSSEPAAKALIAATQKK
ncbi:MAG: conjugal transfer protein TraG N-terminal domain-containing protein [Acinetobacter sp.]|uniref:conjugal transfer protein TraG N-terminal domain-containing protein n=1 Tax=Acinetobacter sp. TaxID=472 RepID=UPI0026084F04|nr:conjugal transfer protein TraG N-terminal domain-containing protein [Acinetobacter sp.]MDD2944364.1 conjugal transfer protein TraG N-terminal domain-containing protein [Acinetobacter sp.]